MPPRRRPSRFALAAAAVLVAACSSTSSQVTPTSAGARPTTPGARAAGTATVFAAASLTTAFNDAKPTLAGATPALTVTYNFAGSNALAAQITQGAPADVFASADAANMQKLVDAGLVGTPTTFARNKLQIAVAPGNPKNITGLADLATPGVTVVLEAVGVPAGDYTRQMLASPKVTGQITVAPKSLEPDVKSALGKLTSGEADATVVYVTDVVAVGAKVTGVAVPDDLQPAITYPIAVVKASKNPGAAQAFVDSAVSGVVQKALVSAGFLAPS